MNPLGVLRDSFYFCQRNLWAIAQLCLPLLVLESLGRQLVGHLVGADGSPVFDVLVGLLFYPLYTGALILFLDARSNGDTPRHRDLLAVALRIWPPYALLAAISTLLIMLGMSLLVLPALWVMVKLAFSEYLLVLHGLTPLAAIKQSLELSRGRFWKIMACLLAALIPLWLLDDASGMLYPAGQSMLVDLVIDSLNGFLQLFTSVVMFRLFMLVTEPDLDHSAT
jgi:hypothetical protein